MVQLPPLSCLAFRSFLPLRGILLATRYRPRARRPVQRLSATCQRAAARPLLPTPRLARSHEARSRHDLTALPAATMATTSDYTPLLPLLKPQQVVSPPRFPARPTHLQAIPGHDWTVTTHIFPAAFPRSRVGSSTHHRHPQLPLDSPRSSTQAKADLEIMLELQQTAKVTDIKDPAALAEEEPLWIAVNRYQPRSAGRLRGDALTVVAAHANGMCKETFEPTFGTILTNLKAAGSRTQIREFWSIDCISHGQSAELNRHTSGCVVDMTDTGRDIANLLINYLPDPGPSAPFLLRRRSEQTTHFDKAMTLGKKVNGHTLAFLGHSLAAIGMLPIMAALPDLFSSAILIDPILLSGKHKGVAVSKAMAYNALTRPHVWQSKAEAIKMIRAPKGSMFQRWDSAVRERFEEFGLQPLSNGRWAVKCDIEQEALVYLDPHVRSCRAAADSITRLSPSLKLHFLLADPRYSVMELTGLHGDMFLEQAPCEWKSMTRIFGAGHCVVQEKPDATGQDIAAVFDNWYGRPSSKL